MSAFLKAFTAFHVWSYRKTGGKMGGTLMGQPVVLLTTTGRKTGLERTSPLMSFEDAGKRYIIASAGGAPADPAWFNNLKAQPLVTVQKGKEVYKARASSVPEPERTRLYRMVAGRMANFASYEKKAAPRVIPVVELAPA